MVVLTSSSARLQLERIAPALGVIPEYLLRVEQLAARIESDCPGIIVIDTDVLGRPHELCRMARSLREDVVVLGLMNPWCERERDLAEVMDVVLHKPPRPAEWRAALLRFGAGRRDAPRGVIRARTFASRP